MIQAKNPLKGVVEMTNLRHIIVKLPNGNTLRIHASRITLENQISNTRKECHPLIVGWSGLGENLFQLWINSQVEDCVYINTHGQKYDFEESMEFLPNSAMSHEATGKLEFADGTQLELHTENGEEPISVTVHETR
tara:strand:+ start:162 stop:569 length:408 start_codon:yes stop_codon:yes gene_type:complete